MSDVTIGLVGYNVGMSTISTHDLVRDPDGMLARVEAGERIVVVRGSLPVAELRPLSPHRVTPRPFGLAAGDCVVADDFDAPLPDEILGGFEGR